MLALIDRDRNWLRDHLNEHSIVRCHPGQTWPTTDAQQRRSPGSVYLWMFQPRRSLFDPEFSRTLATYIWETVLNDVWRDRPFQFGAIESAGLPLAMALQWVKADAPNLISIRKTQKPYGPRNQIEGTPNDLPVLLVDDILGSGKTLFRAAQIVHEEGLELHSKAAGIFRKTAGVNLAGAPIKSDLRRGIEFLSPFQYSEFDLHWEDYQASRSIPIAGLPVQLEIEGLGYGDHIEATSGGQPGRRDGNADL